jgi:hypothetical protein
MSEITPTPEYTVYEVTSDIMKRMYLFTGETGLMPSIGMLEANQESANPYPTRNTYTNTTTFSEAATLEGFTTEQINEVIERYNNE